ncbi:fatty acid-binding protein, liver-like [Watersipora subatra]|uniref:fatty acid-binding protein, liver-like n=1 Tax=Watersipora subatra TaxID=2589382 RepID=UPI00355BE0C3
MSVVESFIGAWRIDNDASENLEGYLEALGLTEEVVERAIKSEVEVEWKLEGDTITQVRSSGGRSYHISFVLQEPYTETLPGGKEFKTTYMEEDGKLIRIQKGSPYNCTSTIELINGQLVETRVCESPNPVSCIRRMNRL